MTNLRYSPAAAALLCLLLLGPLGSLVQCALYDWDSYETHGNASLEEAMRLVRTLPMNRYFDIQKGGFRIGMLPDMLHESHSSYVVNVPRVVRDKDGTPTIIDVRTVDITEVFSRSLPVIQLLADLGSNVSEQIDAFYKEKDDFALKIIRIATETGKEWRTAGEIRGARDVLLLRLEGLKQSLQYADELQQLKKENVQIRHEKRRQMRVEHNEKLISLRSNYETEMVALKLRRQNESLAFSKDMQSGKYREKERHLEEEYKFAAERLMTEIEMSIDAIRYRGQEESRVERENEHVASALLQASGELQGQRVQAVLDTFFIEFEAKIRFIFDDPKVVGIGAVAIVASLALIVVLSELFNSGKSLLKAFMRRNSLLTQVGTVSASSSAATSGDEATDLILKALPGLGSGGGGGGGGGGTDVEAQRGVLAAAVRAGIVAAPEVELRLADLAVTMLLSKEEFKGSRGRSLPGGADVCCLPNILISSPHGNGKSMAAKLLVHAAGIDYAIISGNDLRAHGAGADRTLRRILEACVSRSAGSQRQFVLVIDDVDAMALSPGKGQRGSGTRSPGRHKTPAAGAGAGAGGAGRGRTLTADSIDGRAVSDMAANHAPSLRSCIHLLLHAFKNSSRHLGLVLTSTAPPEALNEALLDRMDHIIRIGVPSPALRLQCCLRQTQTLLARYMSDSDGEGFKELYNSVLVKNDFSVINVVNAAGAEAEAASGAATPRAGRRKAPAAPAPAAGGRRSRGASEPAAGEQADSKREFDITACVTHLVAVSDNWSYRDVTKTLQSIQCEVLGTDQCVVTTRLWMQEVDEAVRKWGR
jgi:hypothetical protein